MKIITVNKKAKFNYDIKDKYEAGIVLTGDEVKSIKQGSISLVDSFVTPKNGELFLINCYIAPYKHAFKSSINPRRSRKLLLHKKEINSLIGSISRKGVTLIPLKVYITNRGHIKLEIATAKHKKAASKKRELKERDIRRATERELKVRIK